MTYLNILINETQNCLETINEDENDIYETVKAKYDFIYNDWDITSNENIIGENIYNAVLTADNIAANVYSNIYYLYQYYQSF